MEVLHLHLILHLTDSCDRLVLTFFEMSYWFLCEETLTHICESYSENSFQA